MTIHTKTGLILLATLLIGIVCGALIHGAVLRERRARYFTRLPSPDGLMRRMEQIIRPDDAQRDAVRRVLAGYTPRIAATVARHRAEMTALIDSLHQALKPILTEKQIERLNRRRLPRGRFRGRHGAGVRRPHDR